MTASHKGYILGATESYGPLAFSVIHLLRIEEKRRRTEPLAVAAYGPEQSHRYSRDRTCTVLYVGEAVERLINAETDDRLSDLCSLLLGTLSY